MENTILIVDDEPALVEALSAQLQGAGYTTQSAATAEAAFERAQTAGIDLVLLDISIPVMGGELLLQKLRETKPDLPVVVLTGHHNPALAARCMKNGASDFLTKPCDATRLVTTIRNALQLSILEDRLREVSGEHESRNTFDMLFGRSAAMQKVFEQLRMLAQSDIGVLIEGASGTGKELIARALHRKSARRDGPFVAINCGAIPASLLESELFGHERGAFTGALEARAGCFEQADGGVLFLDEIGEMPPEMQVRLLRVIETRVVQRLAAKQARKVDVRIVAAANRDLRKRVAAHSFRDDLYYRLAVYRLVLPPLRERDNDVVELAERFVIEFAGKFHKRGLRLSAEASTVLRNHAWPGNVRQLRNTIERATLLAQGQEIQPHDLPAEVRAVPLAPPSARAAPVPSRPEAPTKSGSSASLRRVRPPSGVMVLQYAREDEILTMENEEKRILQRALKITKGDVSEAAKRLHIGRATLYRRMKELKIENRK
jgi:DNA-binding NtrC family response regulator